MSRGCSRSYASIKNGKKSILWLTTAKTVAIFYLQQFPSAFQPRESTPHELVRTSHRGCGFQVQPESKGTFWNVPVILNVCVFHEFSV
jgi:hypothetical protein